MGRWFRNGGLNGNLLVQLSGGPVRYQIDVYVVARFQFFYSEGAANWTAGEATAWKRRFADLVYNTWSEQWTLESWIPSDPGDAESERTGLPTARVRAHAVDLDNPRMALISRQHVYLIKVYRRAPGEAMARQHADGMTESDATVAGAARGELPTGTATAELYDDSLDLGPPSSVDGNRQVVAMHEFGHMLGLMHPADMSPGCTMDRNADACYGQAYSPESASIMGRGQVVTQADYRAFEQIISVLVREVPSSGLGGALGWSTDRLDWSTEGAVSSFREGSYELGSSLGTRSRFTRGHARRPGPVGVA